MLKQFHILFNWIDSKMLRKFEK